MSSSSTIPPSSGSATSGSSVELRVNGEAFELPAGSTLLDLLARVDRHPRTVAIEYNGEILPRERFGEITLSAGDRVEVVHFVQGG